MEAPKGQAALLLEPGVQSERGWEVSAATNRKERRVGKLDYGSCCLYLFIYLNSALMGNSQAALEALPLSPPASRHLVSAEGT